MAKSPRVPTRIQLEMLDGREFDFTTRTYICTADRLAFERRFDIPASAMRRVGAAVSLLAQAVASEDAEAVRELAAAGTVEVAETLRDEWIAFFVWRAACRELAELAESSFEDFQTGCALIEFADLEEVAAEAVDPTPASSGTPG